MRCKNCNTIFEGKYCNHCGQQYYTDKDKSMKHLMEEMFHFLTHFEGTFFTTLKAVLFSPGKLTVEYCNGIRKKYFKPLSFFLLIVVIYLIFPMFEGLNMELKYYRNLKVSGYYIEQQIEEKMLQKQLTEEKLAEKFHEQSEKTSKLLLFLLIPFSAVLLYLLFFYKKRFLFDNMILAAEINIFYLLVFFILFPILLISIIKVFDLPFSERYTAAILLFFFSIYNTFIFRKIFAESWWICVIKSIVFAFLHSFVVMVVYKTIVFEVTFLFL